MHHPDQPCRRTICAAESSYRIGPAGLIASSESVGPSRHSGGTFDHRHAPGSHLPEVAVKRGQVAR